MHAESQVFDRLRKFVMYCLTELVIFTIFSLIIVIVTNKIY